MQKFKPSITLISNQSKLTVRVEPKILHHHRVAFYLFLNKTRIETTTYSKRTRVKFKTQAVAGDYYCIAYFKNDKDRSILRRRSNTSSVQALPNPTDYSNNNGYEQQGSTASRTPLIFSNYFIAIVNGSYAALKKNGFKPRSDYPFIKIQRPIRFEGIKDYNVACVMQGWRFFNPIWNEYIETQNEFLIFEILSYMQDWNISRIQNPRSTTTWNDMMTGMRALHIALLTYIVGAHSIELDKQQKTLLTTLQNIHIFKLTQPGFIKLTNHGIWQLLGLRLLCWSLEEKNVDAIRLCHDKTKQLLEFAFDEEGVNTENSPFYHSYSSSLIKFLPKGLFPQSADVITFITQNTKSISAWLTDPHGMFYRIGDTDGTGMSFPKEEEARIAKESHQDEYICRYYKIGYAIVRSKVGIPANQVNSLIFHATHRSSVHGHADKLSFILFHKGIEVLTDSGKYIYEQGDWQDYFTSDRAHNVLGVVGEIFSRHDVALKDTQINEVSYSKPAYRLIGETKYIGNRFGYTREISYIPGKSLTIVDEVLMAPLATLEHRFHLGLDITTTKAEQGHILLMHHGRRIGVLLPDHKTLGVEIIAGSENPIIGWCSPAYNRKEPIDTVLITYPPGTKVIKTIISFHPAP